MSEDIENNVDNIEQSEVVIEPLTQEDIDSVWTAEDLAWYLDEIKDKSFSLRAEDINNAFNMFLNVIQVQVDISKISQNGLDAVVNVRTSKLPQLQDVYAVLTVGKEFYSLLNDGENNNIAVENLRRRSENLYEDKLINNENMAAAYHNTALLYENMVLSKGSPILAQNYKDMVDKYMFKALGLTSNIQLINTCSRYISGDDKMKKVVLRDACERALNSRENESNSAKFQIYSSYAETFDSNNSADIFNGKRNADSRMATVYYKEALNFAQTPFEKVKTLRNIAKKQKIYDKKAYIETKFELINNLTGKEKIKEMMHFVNYNGLNAASRQELLEGAANELIDDTATSKKEKFLLWQNIKNNLQNIYGNDTGKAAVLKQISDQYFPDANTQKAVVLSKKSSLGKDYFAR